MAEATCELMKQWRDRGIKTKFIRMDNAGENKLLEQRSKRKDWTKHLRLFGAAGTVKTATATSPKLADRGAQCMMVGYAESHDGDVYRMWNPVTRRVHMT
jgi:hypothetical protein